MSTPADRANTELRHLIEGAASDATSAASWLVIARSWVAPNHADDDRDPALMLSQNLAKAELHAARALAAIRSIRERISIK